MRKIFSLFVIVAMLFSFVSIAFAETPEQNSGVYSTKGLTDTETSAESNNQNQNRLSGKVEDLQITPDNFSTGGLPNVQIEQAKKWVEKKGYQLVDLLQTLVQPFAIVIFIFCGLLALLGAFGSSSLVFKGIVGMTIAVIVYAIVLAAPELLDFGVAWLHS